MKGLTATPQRATMRTMRSTRAEYQGIPRNDSVEKADRQVGEVGQSQIQDKKQYEGERRKDQEELAQQYETILQECGHGRFQWTLYFVLGLALMADGVEIFVVGFVLPSAEKDMCLSEPNKGMLGKSRTAYYLIKTMEKYKILDLNMLNIYI